VPYEYPNLATADDRIGTRTPAGGTMLCGEVVFRGVASMRYVLAVLGLALSVSLAAADEVPELIKQLKEGDAEARRNAAKSLGESGSAAREVVPALIAALRDSDRYVRRFATRSLGELGPAAKPAVPALNAILREGKDGKEVLDAAATALGKIGDGAGSVATLVVTLRDTSREPEVRRQAAEALGKLGREAKTAIPALVAVLKPAKGPQPAGSGDLRAEAATALAEIATADDKSAVEALTALSTDRASRRDRTLMKAVGDALKKIQSKKS
jgi:HEAT repeat protein